MVTRGENFSWFYILHIGTAKNKGWGKHQESQQTGADKRLEILLVGILVSSGSNNAEYVDEYVDNIQVQIECSEYVLFRTDAVLVFPTHHHLRIIHEVCGEEECTHTTVYYVYHGEYWPEENGEETKEKQYNHEDE